MYIVLKIGTGSYWRVAIRLQVLSEHCELYDYKYREKTLAYEENSRAALTPRKRKLDFRPSGNLSRNILHYRAI